VNLTELHKAISEKLSSSNRTIILTIDGPAGAGKTTLAQEIAIAFPGTEVIHMDDLYRGWLLTLGPTLTRELQSILDQLIECEEITYGKFDWAENKIGHLHSFSTPSLLVLEGVGAGQEAIAQSVDISVWVDIPIPVGLERVLKRDGASIASQMELFLLDQEAYFTAELPQERADFQIPGN
jgi:uridine kinase